MNAERKSKSKSFNRTCRNSYLDTTTRLHFDNPALRLSGPWKELTDEWLRTRKISEGPLPFYKDFEILNFSPRYWQNLNVTCLEGKPRRFFVRLIGSAVESNNGFFGNKRYMDDLPLKNKWVMRREFYYSFKEELPVYSEGPYIGRGEYATKVRRLIAPYAISDREFAFVFFASFDGFSSNAERSISIREHIEANRHIFVEDRELA